MFLLIDCELICVHSYNVNFIGMVLPGDELTVKIKHTAMRHGNFVVGVTTINQRGEKVLEGTAEVAQSTTVYAFTARGSQEQGLGMDLYNSSLAARAVWDFVDGHLISAYGFSIVEIVRESPKKKIIHFGGIKGQQSVSAIWRWCMTRRITSLGGHSLGEFSALPSLLSPISRQIPLLSISCFIAV